MPSIHTSAAVRRRIPSVPILSLATFRGKRHAHLPSLLDLGDALLVTSGRIAIGMALRALGVQPGDTVLVPAYHSLSMIPPVHWCGAQVVFYRIHPDTSPDLADIAARLGTGAKAVMATHFFGFPQDLRGLRALCDAHGAGLLEDCAHCFFGERDGVAVGASGDYAIGSSMKFFPIYEGGCLVSRRHRLTDALRAAGAGFEGKATLNAVEASFAHGRLPLLRMALALPLWLKGALWQRAKTRAVSGSQAGAPALAPSSSDSSFEFDPRWVDVRSSWFSRTVLRRAAQGRIVDARRHHYLELERLLAGAAGVRPLFAALPDGACPWLFPLLAEQPDALCARLEQAGVPFVRFGHSLWPGVDASVCPNSVALGQRLVGLPCHQALSDTERAWLAATVRQALAGLQAAVVA